MKRCTSCQEDFSDKFGFCPVCGTPLNTIKAEAVPVQNFHEESVASPSSIKPTVSDSDFLATETPSVTAAANESFMVDEDLSVNGSTFNFTDSATIKNETPKSNAANESTSKMSSEEEKDDVYDSLIHRDNDYHLTFLNDRGVASRLVGEGSALARDFAKDPAGFTKSMFNSFGQAFRQLLSNKSAMAAIGLAFLAMIGLVAIASVLDRTKSSGASKTGIVLFAIASSILLLGIFASWVSRDRNALQYGTVGGRRQVVSESSNPWYLVAGILTVLGLPVLIFGLWVLLAVAGLRKPAQVVQNQEEVTIIEPTEIPEEQKVDKGAAGTDKGKGGGSKPKQEKPGGGGGQDNQKPASQGKIPQASLEVPQIIPPSIEPPRVKNPSLPVPATVVADPTLFPPDPRDVPYGDPRSKSTDPSMGDGKGGGIGGGDGGGVGPGRGGNTGGGDRNDGGGGPGGGGGGDTDYNRTFRPNEVTQKARITFNPQPEYTEEARKNQVQGTVRVSAVLSASGAITGIRAVSSLPYGLTEKAIAAARRVQFTPAKKDGRNVSQYITLEYNFRMY